jgi:hypothetical protein
MNEPPDYDDPRPKEEREKDATVLAFRGAGGHPVVVPADVATAAERALRAHRLRIGGKSWDEIAVEEQYPNGKAAQAEVARWKSEASALVVENSQREMLTLEVARMDALQSALWPQAMAGHVPSASAVLSIIVNRSKLVGLDPEKMNDDAAQRARTVVVPQDSGGYLAALQRAAGETPAAIPPAVP